MKRLMVDKVRFMVKWYFFVYYEVNGLYGWDDNIFLNMIDVILVVMIYNRKFEINWW